ncbi:DUF547 domain-containing protein [Photobacterium swingsii]|uniref:DUF547 domain-containing protein n=1 Tax=Photobacterium swingsii TaxID=680026 RepID=UPI0040697703
MPSRLSLTLHLILASFILLVSSTVFAAPKADLWPYWQSSDEANSMPINHQLWQQTLNHYIVQQGEQTLISYHQIDQEGKWQLDRYIREMSKLNPLAYRKAEQFAYWVNLYNALTVKLIVDNYPVKSITKLGGLFSFGPWDDEVVTVNGKKLTLNDIEHRILRPIWQDKRIHYAVNCASLGCPNLQPHAFTASNSNHLLDLAAKQFINSKKGVLSTNNKTQLSSIYDWYQADFGDTTQLQQHLNQYRTTPVVLKTIDYDYDWALNEAK